MSTNSKQSPGTGNTPVLPATQQSAAPDAAIESYHPELYNFLLRRLNGAREARDLVQDIYLRFLAVPHREKIRQPQRYLYRIAANLVSEYGLRQRRSPIVFDSEQADQASLLESQYASDDPGENVELAQRLERLFQQLPPTYRTVLLLWAHEGLAPQEIAERLGLTILTTKKYLTRAIAEFRATAEPR